MPECSRPAAGASWLLANLDQQIIQIHLKVTVFGIYCWWLWENDESGRTIRASPAKGAQAPLETIADYGITERLSNYEDDSCLPPGTHPQIPPFEPAHGAPICLLPPYDRGALGGSQTVSCLRPLRRRRLMTARPPGERMRLRKPCLFRRLRLLGWNVRFKGTPDGFREPWGLSVFPGYSAVVRLFRDRELQRIGMKRESVKFRSLDRGIS